MNEDMKRKNYINRRCEEIDRILRDNIMVEIARAEEKISYLYCSVEKINSQDIQNELMWTIFGLRDKIEDLTRLMRRILGDC